MSILGLLTSAAPVVTPGAPPPVADQPLRLLSLVQTVDAPVVERAATISPLAGPALTVGGYTVPTSSLRLIGTTQPGDRGGVEPHSWEWRTNASEVTLRVKLGGLNMPAVQVFVDDSPTAHPYIRLSADSQVQVPLGQHGTWRTVRVDISGSTLVGVDVPGAASVQDTAPRKKLYILGDSWVEGKSYRPKADGTTGVENGPGFEHMAFLTARLLNAAPIIGGIGGTGYVNRAPDSHFGAARRMDRLIGHQPDMVLVFGSINDGGNTGVEEAAKTLYGRLANELPTTPVLVCATQDWSETDTPNATAPNPGHAAAVAVSPNVKGHVEPTVENWVTGAHKGLVNNVYDNAHLTTFGNRLYAEKLAQFIAESFGITAS